MTVKAWKRPFNRRSVERRKWGRSATFETPARTPSVRKSPNLEAPLHLVPTFQKNFSASRLMGDCGADFPKPIGCGQWNCDFARSHHLCRLHDGAGNLSGKVRITH